MIDFNIDKLRQTDYGIDNFHPGIESHKEIANVIYNYIKDNE
jgi:hypothetical protein